MTDTITTESWEARVAREHREETALVAAFVGKLLTVRLPGWTPEVERYDHAPRSVTFTHTDTGARFYVTLPCRYASRHGKVEAIAEWPSDADGGRKGAREWRLINYGDPDPYSIGFSHSKTAKAIGADLSRRLVPLLLEGIEKVNAQLAEQKAEQDGIARDVATLTAAFPESEVREQSYCHAKLDFDGGHARLSNYNPDGDGNTVDLELSNLTVAQAVAVAKLLAS